MANKFYEVGLASLIKVGWVAALVSPANTYIQPFYPWKTPLHWVAYPPSNFQGWVDHTC